jgi:ATP-dependent protease ClpP protease subunit
MEHKYSKIVNREKKQVEMMLFGEIGEKVDGHYFAKELNWLGRNYDEITVKINSEGGDMVQGLSVVSEIRSNPAHIITKVVGVAASMAGVIAVSGDKVVMNDYAQIMLHSPFFVDADGNKVSKLTPKDKKAIKAMKSILVEILTASGKDKEAIDKILSDETWYDSEAAVTEGFASEIVNTKRKDLAALKPLKIAAKVMAELEDEINENSNSNKKSMKKIAARLGLANDASEEQIVAELEKRETAATNAMVAQFLALGEKLGTITKDNKEKAERLAKADMEIAAEMYLTVNEAEEEGEENGKGTMIKDLLKTDVKSEAGKKAAALAAKKWEELSEEEVETLREKDVKTYVAKFKAHYGFSPEIED